MSKKIKIALVKPLIKGHSLRGTGIYTSSLYNALRKRDDVSVSLTDNPEGSSVDIVHYPFFDPFFLTLPLFRKKPTVVTVHDFIPIKFMAQFNPGIKGYLKWQLQKISLKKTAMVITDSFSSKNDIILLAGINPGRIRAIYLAPGEEFRVLPEEECTENIKELKIGSEYILFVGDVNYNKNIPSLLTAFSLVSDSFPAMNLVLVGKGFIYPSKELLGVKETIRANDLEKRVYLLGNLEKNKLVSLYNCATMYIQPSIYEGFGLPILEAMACGCPVVTSSASSLKEITGNSALLIEPTEKGIEEGIRKMLSDGEKREDFRTLGLTRVKSFGWEKCARETAEVYKEVLNNIKSH